MYQPISLPRSPYVSRRGGLAEAPQPVAPRRCPAPARTTTDRCTQSRHTCPEIRDLLCVTNVDGVPFEYVNAVGRDPATRLVQVTSRAPRRVEQFTPPVLGALRGFLANLGRFGIPVEAILTLGSHVCRCVTNTDTLSNHSFGDALDIVGVRWVNAGAVPSRTRETIVHNFGDGEQRQALRRLNACLRLSFATVIDYHRADHRNHFHCDMNRGGGRPMGPSTLVFVQEALSLLTGTPVPSSGVLDAATARGLRQFLRLPAGTPLPRPLGPAFDAIFTRVAAGARLA
jgi:hypothetical protein